MLFPRRDYFWDRHFQRLFVCILTLTLCYGCCWVRLLMVETHRFEQSLRSQPALDVLQSDAVKAIAVALFLVGHLLVVTSMWALGFTGTYLGLLASLFGFFQSSSLHSNGSEWYRDR